MDGGYDVGYRTCPCFWGEEPGSLVKQLELLLGSIDGLSVLDAGCGEGKNAVYLAAKGARVDAFDISELALANARSAWPHTKQITWNIGDVRNSKFPKAQYDIVIAYGLLHCLESFDEIQSAIIKFQEATKVGGYNIVCAFNDRFQDLSAHPGFVPCLLRHNSYVDFYSNWKIIVESDSDLIESHPHNNIRHKHSMTRLITQRLYG